MWDGIKRPWNWLLISVWAQIMTVLRRKRRKKPELSIWSPVLNILLGGWIEWVILPLSFLASMTVLIPTAPTILQLHGQAVALLDYSLALAERLPLPSTALHLFSFPVWLAVAAGCGAGGGWLNADGSGT